MWWKGYKAVFARGGWLLLLLTVFTRDGAAQSEKLKTDIHEGFWFSIGGGLGNASVPRGLSAFGNSLHLSGGISPHPQLLMGIDLENVLGWRSYDGATGGEFRFVTAGVRVYPSDSGGLWMRLGAGGHSSAQARNGFSTSGAVVAFGAGHDFGLTSTISYHVEFTWMVAVTGRGKIFNEPANIRPRSKSLRFGITMH